MMPLSARCLTNRWRAIIVAVSAAALCFAFPSVAIADVNSLRELFGALNTCLTAAAIRGPQGAELTIVFSLRRDGSLFGKPRISYWRAKGDLDQQQAFAKQIAGAFDKCLPIPVSVGLGGAIAGRPLSMRFAIRPREANISFGWRDGNRVAAGVALPKWSNFADEMLERPQR
jgi:hypothetical protein